MLLNHPDQVMLEKLADQVAAHTPCECGVCPACQPGTGEPPIYTAAILLCPWNLADAPEPHVFVRKINSRFDQFMAGANLWYLCRDVLRSQYPLDLLHLLLSEMPHWHFIESAVWCAPGPLELVSRRLPRRHTLLFRFSYGEGPCIFHQQYERTKIVGARKDADVFLEPHTMRLSSVWYLRSIPEVYRRCFAISCQEGDALLDLNPNPTIHDVAIASGLEYYHA